jgi:tyrosyl-tRNA synthetase
MPQEVLAGDEKIVDVLRRLNMVASGAEAKRLMQQNGVRLNDQLVTDPFAVVTPAQLPAVLQVGKRKFVRLVTG